MKDLILPESIYEGTAFALKDAMSTFGNLANGFRENIFIGGGVKSRCWLSIVADVLGWMVKLL